MNCVNRRTLRVSRCRAGALAVAMLPALANAQSATFAAGQADARIHVAANGATVVDIAAANAAGVSHNRYDNFNVAAQGLVLNNAVAAQSGQGGQADPVSQLAGALAPNANLRDPASLILNEVVGNQRSMLEGMTEVHGARADMVLANPHGITCGGCGFVNTDRVTLTTGVPELNTEGALAGFTIKQGDIVVQGKGLDASAQTMLDLVAGAVKIDGRIDARDLVIAAGGQRFDHGGRVTTEAVGGKATSARYAIDSSAIGGMYADRIRLTASAAGTGVRARDGAAANAKQVELTSDGAIRLAGTIHAVNDVSIAGEVVKHGGTLRAREGIKLGAREFVNHGDVVSEGVIDIVATTLRNEPASGDTRIWKAENQRQIVTRSPLNWFFPIWPFQRSVETTTRQSQAFSASTAPTPVISAGTGLALMFQDGRNVGGRLHGGESVTMAGMATRAGADGNPGSGGSRFVNDPLLLESRESTVRSNAFGGFLELLSLPFMRKRSADAPAPQRTVTSTFHNERDAGIRTSALRGVGFAMHNEGGSAPTGTQAGIVAREIVFGPQWVSEPAGGGAEADAEANHAGKVVDDIRQHANSVQFAVKGSIAP